MPQEREEQNAPKPIPQKPAFDAKAAAASLDQDPSAVNQLLVAILAREARAAAKEEAEEHSRSVRAAKRDENSKHTTLADMARQSRCKHLKGGRRGPKAGVKDYAVGVHTFIDQVTVIKCQLCSMKWRKDDTVEFLYRKGKKIKNHTRIGWAEASAMVAQSTNTATSSEIPMDATPRVANQGEAVPLELVEYEL
jgi:hypothetical protein